VVENGKKRRIKGFANTYKRMHWDEPAPTLIKGAHMISSSNTVHPGRLRKDGLYNNARTLSVLEAMIVMGLPSDWPLPTNISYTKAINYLGEGFCPKVVEALVKNII
jgi:DNA (cytosine-5)-methyltransferase 1